MYCSIIGESHCKCLNKRPNVSSLKVDLKGVIRKLFTDHAVYTAFVLKGIVDGTKDVPVFLARLLLNQKDIGDQLKPLIGDTAGNQLTLLLTNHIKLAGAIITGAVTSDPTLNNKIHDLFMNSDLVAHFLTSLNPNKLPYNITQVMFSNHNQFVLDMTFNRILGRYDQEQILYDAYYNEIIEMADALFHAL